MTQWTETLLYVAVASLAMWGLYRLARRIDAHDTERARKEREKWDERMRR